MGSSKPNLDLLGAEAKANHIAADSDQGACFQIQIADSEFIDLSTIFAVLIYEAMAV